MAVIPLKLGGYGAVFQSAADGFKAKGAGSTLLAPAQYWPYATLALGSALAAFMYPHTLTGIFASRSGDTIRKTRSCCRPTTLLLGLIALLGYMGVGGRGEAGHAHGCRARPVHALFPGWFAGFAFAAIGIGALVPAAVMSIGASNLFTRNFWKAYVDPAVTPAGRGEGREGHVPAGQGGRAAGDPVPADTVRAGPAAAGGLVDPADVPGGGVRAVHAVVPGAGLLAGWAVGFFGGSYLAWSDGLKPLHTGQPGRGQRHGVRGSAGAGGQRRGRGAGQPGAGRGRTVAAAAE